MERTWCWVRQHRDGVVAAVLTAASIAILAGLRLPLQPSALVASIAMVGLCALVVGRRRYPITTAVIAGGLIAVPDLTAYAAKINNNSGLFLPDVAAVFLFAFALGSESEWKRSLLGLAALTAGVTLTGPFNPLVEMVTIGPWAAGLVLASRRRTVDQLAVRASELEAERGIFAIQSVRYERARIARELHDIVAHCVSLIVVQAGAGERLTHHDPGSAAEAFESISEAARQAETEIDRLVELLDTSAPPTAPAGLRIVEELVRRVQASGLHITCEFSADSDAMGAQTSETAYRLVQEGVTNAMKHAPGAPIRISVRGHADSVEVEVINSPAARSFSGLEHTGGGHGLAGMRERAARCGGSFDAGPTPDHGWRIVARLPRYAREPAGAAQRATQ